jgi:hypothetical protein
MDADLSGHWRHLSELHSHSAPRWLWSAKPPGSPLVRFRRGVQAMTAQRGRTRRDRARYGGDDRAPRVAPHGQLVGKML